MKRILLFALILLTGTLKTFSQNALDFDGTDDKIDCGNDTSLNFSGKTITLEAWIYPTAWKTNVYEGNVINKEYNTSNHGFMLRAGAGGKLNFAFGNGSWSELTSANTVLSLNTWQHIAGTYDGSMMRIYVNGVAVDSSSVSISFMNNSGTYMHIGGHSTSAYSRFFQGRIDEVKVWSVWRSTQQINSGMNSEICFRTQGLRAYYKFNQGKAGQANFSVKKLTDVSGNRNNGTLLNFTLNGSSSNWVSGQSFSKPGASYGVDTVESCVNYTSPSRRYVWNKSGDYLDTISTYLFGCDSIVNIHLIIKKTSSSSMTAFSCGSYTSPSGNYTWTKSGIYVDHMANYLKCDSAITIKLFVGGGRDSIYPVVCDTYKSPKGKTYTVSGLYRDTLINYYNCDSIIDIFLTVNKSTPSTINRNVCYSFLSPAGKTYTSSGIYTDSIKTLKGCDSIIRIQLKVLASKSTISRTVCYSMLSPSGKYTWTLSGVYQDTIPNYASCDSVITVNLNVNSGSTSVITANVCRSYTYPRTGRIYTQTGVYFDTIQNKRGCDSVIKLDLVITHINTAVVQNGAVLTAQSNVGTYLWLDCNAAMGPISGATSKVFTAVKNGDYAVEVTDGSCADTSDCYTVSGLSLNGANTTSGISVYPNPGSGNYKIFEGKSGVEMHIQIIDFSGKILFEGCTNDSQFTLNAAPGLYILRVLHDGNITYLNLNHQP